MANEYQASVQGEPLPGRAIPRLPTEVSPVETGARVGAGLEEAGSIASQVFDRAQVQARQTMATDANNQIQELSLNLTHNPQTGAFTRQGKDAFNLGQQYLPRFDEQAAQIVGSVQDPRAQQAAMLMAQHARNALSEQLDNHELQQHQKFAVQTAQSSVRIAQQAASANYNHPDILAANRDTLGHSIDQLAQLQGWSDEQKQESKYEAFSAMHTDVIDRMLTDDKPQMAQHYLKTVEADMDPHAAWTAARTIDAHLKEKQNEAKQDILDRYSDSLQAATYGLKNPLTVSRKEMEIAFPKDAQRKWDGLQQVVAAGAQSKEFDQMTPAQISQVLDAKRPTEGGPEAAFAIHGYEMLDRAARQSLSARAQDPAQFAISTHAWQPLDLSNAQSALQNLTQRSNTASDLSERTGVQVPLLTKPEAKQIGDMVNNAPPEKRLALLTSLRNALPDDSSYYSVMHMVAPHSPVTAIVGTRVPPAQSANAPVYYDSQFAAKPGDAETILRGESILNPRAAGEDQKGGYKGGFPMPPDKEGAGPGSYFSDHASDLFRDRPELADATYSAFRSAYAALAADKGKLDGQWDKQIADRAFQMAVGTPKRFNNSTVVVPPGMDPSRLQGLVENAVTATAKATGAPADWKDRIDGYQLRELGGVGSGRYVLVNGNAELKRPDGKGPFVIDLPRQYSDPTAKGSAEDEARRAKRAPVTMASSEKDDWSL